MAIRRAFGPRSMALAALVGGAVLLAGCDMVGDKAEPTPTPSPCPTFGWAEGLKAYFPADAELPTAFNADADDCLFHQWSWEAFAWATALIDGKPRFLSLKTMDDLDPNGGGSAPGVLRLTPRSTKAHNLPMEDYDAAFVEADGSVLVGQNGYPVYASVHMNDSYFDTARQNLIVNGGYQGNIEADRL